MPDVLTPSTSALPPAVAALVAEVFDPATAQQVVPTGTTVDVGSWWRSGRVWLVDGGETVVLAAAGPRPWRRSVPVARLGHSLYNHLTGQLVLAPAPGLDLGSFIMTPNTAVSLLRRWRPRREG